MTSLACDYTSLRLMFAIHVGYNPDHTQWSAVQAQHWSMVLSRGMSRFTHPARLPGERTAHQWSFLRPLATLITKASKDEYDLPQDFGGLDGDLYFYRSENQSSPIRHVGEHEIRRLRANRGSLTSSPSRCAVLPKQADTQSEQRLVLLLDPCPDATYTLQYRYFARQSTLSEENPIPLGASDHAETIRLAILSTADELLNDEAGPNHEAFMLALQSSVDFDRRVQSPENLGYNADRECVSFFDHARSIGSTVGYVVDTGTTPDPGGGEGENPTPDPVVLYLEAEDGTTLQMEDGTLIELE